MSTIYLYDTNTRTLIDTNKKAHTEGICDIVWVPPNYRHKYQTINGDITEENDQIILTGSFDGTIAMLHTNNFK